MDPAWCRKLDDAFKAAFRDPGVIDAEAQVRALPVATSTHKYAAVPKLARQQGRPSRLARSACEQLRPARGAPEDVPDAPSSGAACSGWRSERVRGLAGLDLGLGGCASRAWASCSSGSACSFMRRCRLSMPSLGPSAAPADSLLLSGRARAGARSSWWSPRPSRVRHAVPAARLRRSAACRCWSS